MIVFRYNANDIDNPLTDMFERLVKANGFNNLCVACDNGQFTPQTAGEIYAFFYDGLKYVVGVDASFLHGFRPTYGEIYNESSKELLRVEPQANEDNTVVELWIPNFDLFSGTAQTEIIQYLAPNEVVNPTAQA